MPSPVHTPALPHGTRSGARPWTSVLLNAACGVAACGLAACAGGDKVGAPGGDPPAPNTGATTASLAWSAGGGQTAPLKAPVATAPAVRVVDARGAPVANVAVTFAVTAGGGRVANASATSGTDGVASAGGWTLGAAAGDNALTATATTGGTPVTATLHATARLPRWTVMVYMAADNTLAVAGVHDIDKMEAAGANPDVQTVVQAEFSPAQFRQAGCAASCAHLPNFDTFRYQIVPGAAHVAGPDGPVTTIGNRDMTDPAQLREFVAWAKQAAPAEHYALVLWNHGGGYTGLLEDDTSRPGHFMSLPDLRAALAGSGGLDVLDFDMCLMAGYETLTQLVGIAKVAVFSEQTEPGSGVPYTEMLKALAAEPTLDARGVGALFVHAWEAFYRGGKESTTQSAYDLAAFPAFEQALGAVATTLKGDLGGLGPAAQAAGAASQRYAYAWLMDVGDFADKLGARTDDGTLRGQLTALKARATAGDFRIAQYAANGSADSADVSRSTGIHVLLPVSALPASGPASFDAYQSQFAGKPWTQFLAAYLGGATATATVDQGDRRFQAYLLWDSAAVSRQVDVDLWVLEPDGNVYVPWKGTVSPNGHLTDDSQDAGTYYEGYATNRYVQQGDYRIFAYLYADPQDFRPTFDLVYRFAADGEFTSVFDPSYPRLSKQRRLQDDPSATYEKIAQGAYTDLQLAATFTAGGAASASRGAASGALGGPSFSRAGAPGAIPSHPRLGAGGGITPAQFATLRRLVAAPRRARQAPSGMARSRSVEAALRALVPVAPLGDR